jgi:anthranilate synthase component I
MSGPLLQKRTVHHRKIQASCAPAALYERLYAGEPYGFLYESLESTGRRGRYSFLGGKPYAVFTSTSDRIEITTGGETHRMRGNPLDALRTLVREARMDASVRPFSGGAVGYVSYDAVRFFEPVPDGNPDPAPVPEFFFLFPGEVLVFDHLEKTVDLVLHSDAPAEERLEFLSAECRSCPDLPAPVRPAGAGGRDGFESNVTAAAFKESVARAKEYILAGDIFQVVLSQRFSFPVRCDAFRMYEALREANPSPYMYFLRLGDLRLLGSSPEILVKVLDGQVFIRPLAGTRRRGATAEEDESLGRELLADPKERAEHVMLVDLARNDIGRVCRYGTVIPRDLFSIERYSKVMHMVSNVEGTLRPGADAFDCFAACFPAGTVSGAPKVRAMEIIDELESVRRGVYAGSIGYFDFGGNLDMCIAIRTLVLRGDTGTLQVGAGIVADSDPEHEYQETLNKAKALFQAVNAAGPERVS